MTACVRTRLVTWNCCEVFDEKRVDLLKSWVSGINSWLLSSMKDADVIVVHLQEVGGKKKDMAMLETVGTELQAMAPATDFWFSGMIVQCDTKAPTFTALANAYFVRRTCLDAVQVFRWAEADAQSLDGEWVGVGTLDQHTATEPPTWVQSFKFPTPVPARKGTQFSYWRINGHELLLVNLHNFHDASNLEAHSLEVATCGSSQYAEARRHALVGFMQHIRQKGMLRTVKMFLFGDFNFRLQLAKSFRWLTLQMLDEAPAGQIPAAKVVDERTSDAAQLFSVSAAGRTELARLATKELVFPVDQQSVTDHVFHSTQGLSSFDFELSRFNFEAHNVFPEGGLQELPRDFSPTYPWAIDEPAYAPTRMPAWCDRVLMSNPAMDIVMQAHFLYTACPREYLTGDHKPVVLQFALFPSP